MIVELRKGKISFAMFKYCCYIFLMLLPLASQAQQADKVYVTPGNRGWQIPHTVQNGETVYVLARRYHVPPAILADANRTTFDQPLTPGSIVNIPIAAYNYMTSLPNNMNDARTLYYVVEEDDNLYRISRRAGVPQYRLQEWNRLNDNNVLPGRELVVGWVLYDATQISIPPPVTTTLPSSTRVRPAQAPQQVPPVRPTQVPGQVPPIRTQPGVTYIPMPDTTPEISVEERSYLEQTNNGLNVVEEKGTAAFYTLSAGSNGGLYFAFHNAAARGSIIKVTNPSNGKFIYAKVIGTIPNTKLYHNAIIGISGNARRVLGTFGEDKLWCELQYAGY